MQKRLHEPSREIPVVFEADLCVIWQLPSFFKGQIVELLIYNSLLADRQSVENYLASKYGL